MNDLRSILCTYTFYYQTWLLYCLFTVSYTVVLYLCYYLASILSYFVKRYDFTFPIVNFSFINRNMLASPAYAVNISQLLRYSRACSQYSDFMDRAQLLTQKLLKQGYVSHKLKSSLKLKFSVLWFCFDFLCSVSCVQCCLCLLSLSPPFKKCFCCCTWCPIMCPWILISVLWCTLRFPHNTVPFTFILSCFLEWACFLYIIGIWLSIWWCIARLDYMYNMAGVLETGNAYPSRALGFLVVPCCSSFFRVFCVGCFLFCFSSSCVLCANLGVC